MIIIATKKRQVAWRLASWLDDDNTASMIMTMTIMMKQLLWMLDAVCGRFFIASNWWFEFLVLVFLLSFFSASQYFIWRLLLLRNSFVSSLFWKLLVSFCPFLVFFLLLLTILYCFGVSSVLFWLELVVFVWRPSLVDSKVCLFCVFRFCHRLLLHHRCCHPPAKQLFDQFLGRTLPFFPKVSFLSKRNRF